MPKPLPGPPIADFAAYGVGLGEAVSVIRNNAVAAGLDATVPPCAEWSMADLIRHLGTVHRWACGVLTGLDPRAAKLAATTSANRTTDSELLDWLDDGLVDLLNAVISTPAERDVYFFLENAPPSARVAWARRQCHESTIHAVDAMAARLGTLPTSAQTWISREVAVDGVDELLRGFLPRAAQSLRSTKPIEVLVRTTDAAGAGVDIGWALQVSSEPTVVRQVDLTTEDIERRADVVVKGASVPLYLGLWNRGNEFEVVAESPLADQWRDQWQEQMRIQWR